MLDVASFTLATAFSFYILYFLNLTYHEVSEYICSYTLEAKVSVHQVYKAACDVKKDYDFKSGTYHH